MKNLHAGFAAVLIGALAAGSALAQTTPPAPPSGSQSQSPDSTQPTGPNAASSPHQRAVTKSSSKEAPTSDKGTSPNDASSPHQTQTLKKKQTKKKAPSDSTGNPTGSQT